MGGSKKTSNIPRPPSHPDSVRAQELAAESPADPTAPDWPAGAALDFAHVYRAWFPSVCRWLRAMGIPDSDRENPRLRGAPGSVQDGEEAAGIAQDRGAQMRRLRDELHSADVIVAKTAALFVAVEPLEVSELEVERAWRSRRAVPRRGAPK